MENKVNIILDVDNPTLKNQMRDLLADSNILVCHGERHTDAESSPIAVIDSQDKALSFPDETLLILAESNGGVQEEYFSTIDPDADLLMRELRKAYCHIQAGIANQEALQSVIENQEKIEDIARSLSQKIRDLSKQATMRIELLEQLPVGVIGIDDAGNIVLINQEAQKILADKPFVSFGLPVATVFNEEVSNFLDDTGAEKIEYKWLEHTVQLKKATFELEGEFAGRILAIWEI